MSLEIKAKELVLSFFDMIGSQMSLHDGIYTISIPKRYHNHFRSNKRVITFDENIASQHGCELAIIGSNTLSTILKICTVKAPTSFKKIQGDRNQTVMRYHFFVSFSAVRNMSNLAHIDIDMDTCKPTVLKYNLKYADMIPAVTVEMKNLTSSYATALDELTKKYDSAKTQFIENTNAEFYHDFESAMQKYNAKIREIDSSINKKEQDSNNLEKVQEFRFKGIRNIQELEDEKVTVAKTLQEKHQISLTYNLIACEVIQVHNPV